MLRQEKQAHFDEAARVELRASLGALFMVFCGGIESGGEAVGRVRSLRWWF